MKLIKTAIKRPIGACTIFIILIVFGIISLARLKVSLLPEIVYPKLTIITLFQNVPPSEIESMITNPIEEAIMSVKGINRIQSITRQGLSIVIPVFKWGTDIDVASVNVREKLDMITNLLPDGVLKPIISKIDPSSSPIIGLGVFWKNKDAVFIKNLIEKEIKPELERIDGVAKVSIKGGAEEEIKISVDLDRLNSYRLSLQNIVESIKNANYNFPAGDIIEGEKEYLIRVDGEYKNLDDINNTIIGRSESGGVVKISDIAGVSFGIKERTSYFLLNGKEGIGLEIVKESSANDIDISKTIKEKMVSINEKFESFLKINLIYDSSEFIKSSINGLFISAILAVVITFFVVYIFMLNFKLPLLIILTVPVSILITFIFMYLNNMSLNIMSLGGLALGIGMLVDSAIVVIEEIEGKTDPDMIYEGTNRVFFSIMGSVLTTLVVFVPLIFVQGTAGALFGQLALTISFSLIASIIVSLFLIPVLYTLIAKGEKSSDPKFYLSFKAKFKKILLKNLRKQKVIYVISLIFLILAILLFFPIKKEFMPVVDQGEFYINIAYKNGTPIENCKKYTEEIINKLHNEKSIRYTFAAIGYDQNDPFELLQEEIGVHLAKVRVLMNDKRKEDVFNFVKRISKELKFRDDVNIVYEVPRNIIADVLNLEKSDFSFELYCDGKEKLDNYSIKYREELIKTGIISEIDTSKKEGNPQIKISFDSEALSGSGVNSKAIYDIMSASINGTSATYLRRDDDKIDIKVILEESDRSELKDLSRLNLNINDGLLPIYPFLKNEKVVSPSKILRKNQKEYIKIFGNYIKDKKENTKMIDKLNKEFEKKNPGVKISGGESTMETADSFNQLQFAFLLSVFLIFAILASQFESILRPFLIMLAVPLAFFGTFFALFIFNKSINLNSLIGIVMLGGIVVNNAIILFDKFNFNILELKMRAISTMYYGTTNRFKPVLITTLTTILGLLPMAIGIGKGGELQTSLAISVMGGLTISTILTLFLMPNLYYLTINKNKIND